MDTTWMIRNDGKAFPCVEHIYANPENMEETLFAAEWLYANTRHEESRYLVLETVAVWTASVSVDRGVTSNVLDVISRKPYRFLSQEFVMEHATDIEAISTGELNLATLCGEVASELNQEFLRAHYGGIYHTDTSSREMVFRISSVGFDWYKIIRSFVTSANFPIERVIIVRDEESIGAENKFYLSLPREAFLSAQTIRLTLQNKIKGGVMNREILAHLTSGSALRHISWDLAISTHELVNTLQIFSYWESCSLMVLSKYAAIDGIFLWDETDDFHEGLARVRSGDNWGYIDGSGCVVIKPQFRHVTGFHNGFACVYTGDKCGYIDKSGTLVTAVIYDDARRPYMNDERGCCEAKVNLSGEWITIPLRESQGER